MTDRKLALVLPTDTEVELLGEEVEVARVTQRGVWPDPRGITF